MFWIDKYFEKWPAKPCSANTKREELSVVLAWLRVRDPNPQICRAFLASGRVLCA